MRTVCVFFAFLLPLLGYGETYKVSQLKFENFKAYDSYEISLDTIRGTLISFSKKHPSFDQSGLFLLAAELAELYRQKGLVFHRVEVLRGDPTRLVLIPGVMSAIDVRGNQLYRNKQISPFFDDLFGNLVDNATLQAAMIRMNSLPGISGFAFLSFGQQPGDAVLNVSASQESWGQLSTRLNNYGSNSTGEYRIASQLTLNNPLKLSEQWRMGGSISDEVENWSGNLAVDFHLKGKHLWSLSGQYQNMVLAQDFSLLDMSGWQANGALAYEVIPLQTFDRTFSITASLGFLQQELNNDANISFFDIELQDIPMGIALEGDLAANKSFLGYEMGVDGGYLLSYTAPVELDEDLWGLARANLSFARSITGGALQQGIDLKAKLTGQYAITPLPAHRRFGLSGQGKVASMASGAYTADTAVFGELNLTLLNLRLGPFQTVWQGLAQAGWGVTGEDDTGELIGLGTAIDVNLGPITSQVKAFTDQDFKDYTVWFEVTLNWPKG